MGKKLIDFDWIFAMIKISFKLINLKGKVSFIDFNDPTIQGIIDIWIKRNNYTSEGCKENQHPDFDLARDLKNPTMTDYKRYYTQKELDIVWKLYENVFNEFGYQREFI